MTNQPWVVWLSSGQLSPTLAVMAGMMRDRIVQSEMKPPSPKTVAEEVMQPMGHEDGTCRSRQQAPQQTVNLRVRD
jgi:hypothetical protein